MSWALNFLLLLLLINIGNYIYKCIYTVPLPGPETRLGPLFFPFFSSFFLHLLT